MGRMETLAAVREQYPQYADMPDDQLGAALAAKYPEYADLAPPRGNLVRRAYKAVAEPVTKAASGLADVLTEPGVAAMRLAQGEPVGQVLRSYNPFDPGARAATNVRSAMATNPVASVVPQSPLEALAMTGTLAAGPLAPLARVVPALARVLAAGRGAGGRIVGGAIGGELGGQLSGETTGKGALIGGGGAAAGEAIGKVIPWLRPRGGGGRQRMNLEDVAKIGDVMPPALGKPKTAVDMWEAAVAAPKRLGMAKEVGVQELEGMLPGGVPSRFKALAPPPAEAVDPGAWMAAAAEAAERSRFAKALGPAEIDIPSLGQSMSLRDANALLSKRGDVLSGRAALDPRFKFRDPAQAYAQLAQDIEAGVEAHGGAKALAKWREIQDAYKAGRAEIKPFQLTDAYQPGQQAGEAQVNLVQVARWLRNPKNAAWMIDRIGRHRYDELVGQITRGAGPLATDIMEPGLGRSLDAAQQSIGRGANTGSLQVVGVPLRTLIPGLGRQLAGRAPYAPPAPLQAILDAALQRAGGAALESSR